MPSYVHVPQVLAPRYIPDSGVPTFVWDPYTQYILPSELEDLIQEMGANASIIAQSVDRQNTAVPLTLGTWTQLTPRITIPPSTRWRKLEYGGGITITTAGAGLIGIGVADTTSGGVVEIHFTSSYGSWVLGTFNSAAGWFDGSVDIGPADDWKSYRLIGGVFRDSGTLAVSAAKSSTAASPAPGAWHNRAPFLRAVA